MKEERRKDEDGGGENGVQWLNWRVSLGNIIIFHLDSPHYLSNNLLFLCHVNREQILHESATSTFQVEAGNVFFIIYCSLKFGALTQFTKPKTAQLNRSRHTCTSSIRFVSVTCVFCSRQIEREKAAGKGARKNKTKRMSKSFVYLRSLPRYQLRQDKMKD